jgi:hypothetical protein
MKQVFSCVLIETNNPSFLSEIKVPCMSTCHRFLVYCSSFPFCTILLPTMSCTLPSIAAKRPAFPVPLPTFCSIPSLLHGLCSAFVAAAVTGSSTTSAWYDNSCSYCCCYYCYFCIITATATASTATTVTTTTGTATVLRCSISA